MSKLIIANWKMNLPNLREWRGFAGSRNVETVIAPPFSHIVAARNVMPDVKFAAQNVFWEARGPYTGEVSAFMLNDLGVEYVIVGHSERRAMGETDEMIAKKVKAALDAKLKPILCVGESFDVHKKGQVAVKKYIERQLTSALSLLKSKTYHLKPNTLIIAYEPVWAISTNSGARPDTPENAVRISKFIKKVISHKSKINSCKVLYGGSVNSQNAWGFLFFPAINGALVGGASLKVKEFKKIVAVAE